MCCFCDQDETIRHMFFSCPFVRFIWRIILMNFYIPPPLNITNLFGNWLNWVVKKNKDHIRVGVCALLWAFWNVQNDFIFTKRSYSSFLQVIPLVIHWIHIWSYLQLEEQRQDMDIGCNRLGVVARDFYIRCGWRTHRRTTSWTSDGALC
jgi:hypothetical protein